MTFERRLQTTHPEPKFWHLTLAGEEIVLRSGRLGTPGTQSRIPCKSAEAAQKTAESLVAQRLRDGFTDEAAAPATSAVVDDATEAKLLEDDPERWLVFSDSLMETPDAARGELIAHQVRAAKRVRGSIGQAKKFIQDHYDELVGELAGFHKQVSIDWRFGYARSVRVWSGPHSAPIAEVLPYVFLSPACRFLERLELGSPGTEGRYDATLRALAKLEWPKHLGTLFLGNFDVALAKETDSAWPRLDSLSALQPVAARVRGLELRAAMNGLGRSLSFPNLERLVLMPSRIDARVTSDLQAMDAPKLRTLSFTQHEAPAVGLASWAATIRRWLMSPGITELGLKSVADAVPLLAQVGDPLKRLEVLDLRGSVKVTDAPRMLELAPLLSQARLELGEAVTLRAKLSAAYPKLGDAPARDATGLKSEGKKKRRPRRYDDASE